MNKLIKLLGICAAIFLMLFAAVMAYGFYHIKTAPDSQLCKDVVALSVRVERMKHSPRFTDAQVAQLRIEQAELNAGSMNACGAENYVRDAMRREVYG